LDAVYPPKWVIIACRFTDERVQENIKEFVLKHGNRILDEFPIDKELIKYSDNIETEIKEKTSQHSKDKYKDDKYLSYVKKDQEIWSEDETEKYSDDASYEDIVELITLNSDILRNTTEITSLNKQYFIKNNVNAYLALMWQSIEVFKDIVRTTDQDGLKVFLFFKSNDDAPELNDLIDKARNLVLQIIPLSTILYMSEHLLNPKLKRSIISIVKNEPNLSKKLFYVLMLLDLDIKESLLEAKKILKFSKSIILDHLLFLYLLLFCRRAELSDESFDDIVHVLQDIRKKHVKEKHCDTFVTDKFESNLKKNRLMLQQK